MVSMGIDEYMFVVEIIEGELIWVVVVFLGII